MLCPQTDCVNIKLIPLCFFSYVNQTKFRANHFFLIVQNSIMLCLDDPTMSNTCVIVFVLHHRCAYLFTFSFRRYMYVFINNTSLLYIPVHLQVLMIMHVISIISCSFNTFFIAFGVLLTLVLRTCNTFYPLNGTCKKKISSVFAYF